MSDFSVRSDNVDVEQIMRQIRARIREKRGVDYTEEEIRELANVKLEKFIDPKGVRSNLLEEYRRVSTPEPAAPNYAFGEDTLYETHRAPIRWLRSLLRPFLKLLFNPNPLIQALHIQSELNQKAAERNARREQLDALHYEVIHNLVVELTRTGIEVNSLKMRLESMASRLDFDERRARALEGVVQYRPGAVPPLQPPTGHDQSRRHDGRRDQGPRDQGQRGPRPPQGPSPQGPGIQGPRDQGPGGNALDNEGNERRARRRRRRGRRRPGEERGGELRPAFAGGESNASFGDQGTAQSSVPANDQTQDRPSTLDTSASAEATADRRPSMADSSEAPAQPTPSAGEPPTE
ncbi:MAG TPA: hypothetical protein VEL51_22770 [Vicinamibacterales bacterium]|nr:hypothetical protein [Vicinamibacterales bacterium]